MILMLHFTDSLRGIDFETKRGDTKDQGVSPVKFLNLGVHSSGRQVAGIRDVRSNRNVRNLAVSRKNMTGKKHRSGTQRLLDRSPPLTGKAHGAFAVDGNHMPCWQGSGPLQHLLCHKSMFRRASETSDKIAKSQHKLCFRFQRQWCCPCRLTGTHISSSCIPLYVPSQPCLKTSQRHN